MRESTFVKISLTSVTCMSLWLAAAVVRPRWRPSDTSKSCDRSVMGGSSFQT